ncbi:MAG TPA: 2OG-Fe(II) oxygenase [Methylomirabilota bacterium]|jgi:hypothetical protein|nr:2OG-Fe(II) oxygenase [Methylomirabilota bacterium]HEV8676067.1 2OG-Fe(II) oxygenase [Methylomirabilota bacterium]
MGLLNLDVLRRASLSREPFEFLIVSDVVTPEAKLSLERDFPRIPRAGSFPVSELVYGPSFSALLAELRGPGLRSVLSEKFGMELAGLPTMVTVRGRCHPGHDGQVHTDATWKVISLLLYLNDGWQSAGGRLRLLRSENLDDVAAEVPAESGALVAFRRSERSFHGHKPFDGERRVIQVNWVTSQRMIDRELARHRRTAWLKRLVPFGAR